MKHTETPYNYCRNKSNDYTITRDGGNILVADNIKTEANASFITKALNNHNKLVKALRDLAVEVEMRECCKGDYLDNAFEVLSQLEEEN